VKIYERNMARRNELYAKLKNGRPHRMRQATFDREQRELARLNNWLKKARPKASSADHRYIVRGDWLPAKDLPSGLAVDAYSVQNGELVKEDWFSPPPKFRRDVG
jgi:hypothetical protein